MRVSIGLVAVSALMFSACTGGYDYDVPLDPDSPWPKFRRTARQDGRSPVVLEAEEGAEPWVFQTDQRQLLRVRARPRDR